MDLPSSRQRRTTSARRVSRVRMLIRDYLPPALGESRHVVRQKGQPARRDASCAMHTYNLLAML